jgi:hypothetical protein
MAALRKPQISIEMKPLTPEEKTQAVEWILELYETEDYEDALKAMQSEQTPWNGQSDPMFSVRATDRMIFKF